MKEVRQIKQLQSHLSKLLGEKDAMKIELANRQREYEAKLKHIEKIKDEISKLNNDEKIKVSEHAIVRYFERVKGFNIEEIEQEIVSDEIRNWTETLGGSGTYPNGEFKVCMKNFVVTTIV